MKISTKLVSITLGSAVIVTGLVLSLMGELKSVSTGYTRILQGPVHEAEEARQAQVHFGLQVQAFHDILLRGENPDDLAKFTDQFREQEARVKAETGTLAGEVDDPETRQLLHDLVAREDELSARYQAAYGVYINRHFDYRGADAMVRGEDRAPSDLFDKVVVQLNARVAATAAAQQSRTIRQLVLLLVVVGGLFFVDSVVYCSVLIGVLKRLGQLKAVSDRLAMADIEGLSIDISGHDEIGAIGESMKGIEAAIHELLAVHSH